jgi:hypothetical protein
MVNIKASVFTKALLKCCGSGFRIQDPVLLLTPKYWIRYPVPVDPWIRDLGWKNGKIRIRDKHPGSVTLLYLVANTGYFTGESVSSFKRKK